MVGIGLKFKGKVLVDTLGALMIFREEYRKGFDKSLGTLRDMVKERTPVGATRSLYESIGYRVKELTPLSAYGLPTGLPEFEGEVFSSEKQTFFMNRPVTYARAVEIGTRPHWPPWLELYGWVQHVLGPFDERTLSRTSFFVARKISRVGTGGRFMFRDAYADFQSQGIFEKNMQESLDMAVKKATAETPWWAKMWPD